MTTAELQAFKETYEKFYIERFLYSNAEIEVTSRKQRLQDIKRMSFAYRFLMRREDPLTLGDLQKLGSIINGYSAGKGFRKVDVTAGEKATFEPAPKQQVIPKMNELLYHYYHLWDELDPFEKEARFHIKFMRIHPFEDGNKRSGKLILTTNLCKQQEPPIIITKEDTDLYYRLINDCDYDEFANFLRYRSSVEDNTMCGFYKAQNGLDALDKVKETELRKVLLP